MSKTNNKVIARKKRIKRIRKKITGTPDRLRLRVFKSNKHIYAQLIDDVAGHTVITESTLNNEIDKDEYKNKTAQAGRVGELIGEKAKTKGIDKVIFDRGGYRYHGRVKSLSEGARKAGLNF